MDAHIAQRLATERIAWLATVDQGGRPHNVPVWFVWHDGAVLFFSLPTTQKVEHLRHNPACTFGLETEDGGNDVAIVEGRAEFPNDEDERLTRAADAFARKYEPLLAGGFPEWRQQFSLPVLVRAERVRAWRKEGGELRFTSTRP